MRCCSLRAKRSDPFSKRRSITVAIGGVGELGVSTLAPALAGAWARLTGQQERSLPFYPNATMGEG